MVPGADGETGSASSSAESDRLAAIRSAESLADLQRITGADSEHEAYFEAKELWYEGRGRELAGESPGDGLPGNRVAVDGDAFVVHGVTHADTPQERAFLRDHVSRFLAAGASVYCEQGIRSMYFEDLPAVREMDDYSWAMEGCRDLAVDSRVDGITDGEFDRFAGDVASLASRFREAVFSLIESGDDVYGEDFAVALGDVASGFLTSHEDLATAEDFESFTRSRQAAEDPSRLADLQRYYERAFLPQPLEREWLRRHDRELELVTHARNERMADYAVYHAGDATPVHLVVGAAHQPGVTYYLAAHRDGRRPSDEFEPVG